MDREAPMYTTTTTVAERITVAEAMAAGMEDKMEATAGLEMRGGVKGTLPNQPTPKTEIHRSVETRLITIKSDQDDDREGGKVD